MLYICYIWCVFSFYKCKECGKHFNLKSDYGFHLREHFMENKKIDYYSNTSSCTNDTDYSYAMPLQRSPKDFVIVQEINFGVYVY